MCKNCSGAHITWQCPAIHALLFAPEQATLDRIYANVLERLAHPHPCNSCGNLTAADLCAACQEDRVGDIIAGMVHDAFPLRSGLEMSLERVVINGVPIPF